MKNVEEIIFSEIERIQHKISRIIQSLTDERSALGELERMILDRLNQLAECSHHYVKCPGKRREKCRNCKAIKEWNP